MGSAAVEGIRDAIGRALLDPSGQELPFDVAIMAFDNRSTHLLGLDHRQSAISTALQQLTVERDQGRTRLYDVIAGAAAELRTAGGGGKRVLVVSDGRDEGSGISLERLIELLGVDITVDAIGFGTGARAASASGALSVMTQATRGRFVAAASMADLQASMVALLKPPSGPGGAGSATAAPAAPPAAVPPAGTAPPTTSGPALHSVKVNVHASTDAKCLQLAYGVAVDSLQEVSATTTLVSGRLGAVNLSINCVALGAGQSSVAVVTAAGGTALAATQVGNSIAAKLAAATN